MRSTHPLLFNQLLDEAKQIKEDALLLDRQINRHVDLSDEEEQEKKPEDKSVRPILIVEHRYARDAGR